MKMNVKNKIVLINIGILIPAILFICLVTINNLCKNIIDSSVKMLTQESYNTQLYVMNYLNKEKFSNIDVGVNNMGPFIASYLFNYHKFPIQIYSKDNKKIADTLESPMIEVDKDVESATSGVKGYVIKKFQNRKYILFSIPIYVENETVMCVRYIYPIDSQFNIIRNTIITMIVFAMIALGISIILSYLFSSKLVRPILKLKDASIQVSKGDFTKLIRIDSKDEIGELANSFNIMSEKICSNIQKLKEEKENEKRLFDNVTHEFKTPLTSIMGYSELLNRVTKKEDVEQCTYYIMREGKRLLSLVEQLLNLSKLNKNQMEMQFEYVNIREVLEESILILKPRLKKFNIEVKMEIFDETVFIDSEKTEQVVLNILDNSIKYSDCTEIKISMERLNQNLMVYIEDNGTGIPEEDLSNIFKPFYTAHKSLQNKYGGAGLGLCVSKEIMKKQNGDIKIESSNGVKVRIYFRMLQV